MLVGARTAEWGLLVGGGGAKWGCGLKSPLGPLLMWFGRSVSRARKSFSGRAGFTGVVLTQKKRTGPVKPPEFYSSNRFTVTVRDALSAQFRLASLALCRPIYSLPQIKVASRYVFPLWDKMANHPYFVSTNRLSCERRFHALRH